MAGLEDSRRQESSVAEDTKGKIVPASGATAWAKRDVRTLEELMECKITDKNSYSISFRDLTTLRYEAYSLGVTPVYVIENMGKFPGRYAVIPWSYFLELRGLDAVGG